MADPLPIHARSGARFLINRTRGENTARERGEKGDLARRNEAEPEETKNRGESRGGKRKKSQKADSLSKQEDHLPRVAPKNRRENARTCLLALDRNKTGFLTSDQSRFWLFGGKCG